MTTVHQAPSCGQCGRAARNVWPLCTKAICLECLAAASLDGTPALCLCPEPEAANCAGRTPQDLLPKESCYDCKNEFPISAVASGELTGICAIFLCQPCATAMVQKDLSARAA